MGDNLLGLNPDAFPNDATQWNDTDGDGYGDNLNGRNADLFPDDPTQHADADGELGDNQSGTDADPSLNDFDNDGYTDDEDTLPKLASPGDKDNDGVPDEEDAFPDDFRESKDSDGDGRQRRLGRRQRRMETWTISYNSASQPVVGVRSGAEGTQVIGAWDLIGVFTGVPLGFGDCSRVPDVLAGSKWSWIKPKTAKPVHRCCTVRKRAHVAVDWLIRASRTASRSRKTDLQMMKVQ